VLFSLTSEVDTITNPVVAPLGTTAVRYVSDTTLKLEAVPLKKSISAFEPLAEEFNGLADLARVGQQADG